MDYHISTRFRTTGMLYDAGLVGLGVGMTHWVTVFSGCYTRISHLCSCLDMENILPEIS